MNRASEPPVGQALRIECPCCHGAKRLTVIEHDDTTGRTFLTRPLCCHCMGAGTVVDDRAALPADESAP